MHTLFLASKSSSRKKLLHQANIPFAIIDQQADESFVDWQQPLDQLVTAIARHKMEQLMIPPGTHDGQYAFIITADTMSQHADGTVNGKPKNRADAHEKIKKARQGNRLCTAFCLDKRIWHDGQWHLERRIERCVKATLFYDVPDELIDYYLDHSHALSASGAIAVEDFGLQFLKSVTGSYTAIIGLPLFELRQELMALGFFS